MKRHSHFFVISLVVAVTVAIFADGYGQDADSKKPGSEEAAAIDRSNAALDKVYRQLMKELKADQKRRLKEAQRAWIKWRDAESEFSARLGGAVGDSALRVDHAVVQKELIEQRTEVLEKYLKNAESNR